MGFHQNRRDPAPIKEGPMGNLGPLEPTATATQRRDFAADLLQVQL
jgi:hypothetical protein